LQYDSMLQACFYEFSVLSLYCADSTHMRRQSVKNLDEPDEAMSHVSGRRALWAIFAKTVIRSLHNSSQISTQ